MLPLSLKLSFEECQRSLSPIAQLDLHRLAEKLKEFAQPAFRGESSLTSFTRVLSLTNSSLNEEECRALALYSLCVLDKEKLNAGEQTPPTLEEEQSLLGVQYAHSADARHEGLDFEAVRNMMKSKHGTVKISILKIA